METRQDVERRLESHRIELPLEQARLASLELALQIAIESHIASCYRELHRLAEHKETALSGEADPDSMLAAERNLDECRQRIKSLERTVEELVDELADDELWADQAAEQYQLDGESASHIPGAWG